METFQLTAGEIAVMGLRTAALMIAPWSGRLWRSRRVRALQKAVAVREMYRDMF